MLPRCCLSLLLPWILAQQSCTFHAPPTTLHAFFKCLLVLHSSPSLAQYHRSCLFSKMHHVHHGLHYFAHLLCSDIPCCSFLFSFTGSLLHRTSTPYLSPCRNIPCLSFLVFIVSAAKIDSSYVHLLVQFCKYFPCCCCCSFRLFGLAHVTFCNPHRNCFKLQATL